MIALAFATLALLAAGARAEVEFQVSPEPVVAGESCRLIFRLAGSAAGDPDFSPLGRHFDILSRQQRSSLNFVNGKREQWTTWELTAIAAQPGTIEIPAINFGADRTVARTIEVVAAAPPAQGAVPDIVFETRVDTTTPYVQQQVIYTVRLLHRVELSGSRRSAIETSSDTIIKPLGEARRSREKRDGVSYDVLEHQFAVFPQESGTLEIAPLTLTTQVVERARRSFFDPFSQSLQTRRLQSEGLTLEVRPIPAAFPADATWLPARRLRLHDEWEPASREAAAGTPVSRTLFLWADGLTAGQLPDLELEAADAVRVYPDQPQSNERPGDGGFTAVVQRKFALIGGAGLTHALGEITIPWWNLETDTLELARLPAAEIRYLPGAGVSADRQAAPAAAAPTATPGAAATAAGDAGPARPWQWLAGCFALAWLLTAAAWWRTARRHGERRRAAAAAGVGSALRRRAEGARALKAACGANDPAAARDALLAWAAADDSSPAGHLREVRMRAHTAEFAAAVGTLERCLYGPEAPAPWQGADLWTGFRREPRTDTSPATETPRGLPPVFKLARE